MGKAGSSRLLVALAHSSHVLKTNSQFEISMVPRTPLTIANKKKNILYIIYKITTMKIIIFPPKITTILILFLE
jgi:hypothetical protein